MREGLTSSGWECVYANDNDANKRQIYEARFGVEHFHEGDVWQTDEVTARIADRPFLATASFPCIDVSLAGKYRGMEGEHSSAFYGFAKVVERLGSRRPPVIMLENVVGLVTSKEGEDFIELSKALSKEGYWIDAFVIDAAHFVPQSRPRIFVVAVQGEHCPPNATRQNPDDFMDPWQGRLDATQNLRPKKLAALMKRTELPTGWMLFDLPALPKRQINLVDVIDRDTKQDWWAIDELERHLAMMSEKHGELVDRLVKGRGLHVGTIYRRVRQKQQRAEVRFDGLAGCLRTPKGGSAKQIVIVIDKGEVRMRWMSPREYGRLQGAGDYPLVGGRIQQLYGFGDAVCVPVIKWIDEHVLTPIFKAACPQ